MTNSTNPAWLDQVQILPTTDAIQAADTALKRADTPEQQEAAKAALLGAMLSSMADELK